MAGEPPHPCLQQRTRRPQRGPMLGRHCRWAGGPTQDRSVGLRSLPPPTTGPTKDQTALQPNRRKLGQLCWCHPLLPLTPSIPYPTPMHTCTRPTISSLLRRKGPRSRLQQRTSRPQRGPMLGRHCRRAGGLNQRRNADPSLPLAAAAARCGCRACPALFPFVDFAPFFTQALGLRSARALADTTCSPLSTFPTPPSGALRPPSGPCLADTVRLPLSTCPSRLNPKLRRVCPGRTGRKIRAAQFKSSQIAACRGLLAAAHP